VPSGLDGNPNPVSSERRAALLEQLAGAIVARREAHPDDGVLLVAIDGIDGAGKTTFADELGAALTRRGVPVIRSTTDSFHNPREVRRRRGILSPEGFYRDSHDLERLSALLLDPLRAAPSRPFRVAAFDEPSDSPVDAPVEVAKPGSVLLFDGLFLSRPELRGYWDYFIYVDGERRVADERITRVVDECPDGFAAFWHLVRWWAILERYVGGQRLYLSQCQPRSVADAVVDNNDLVEPTLTLA
jgi:uridine kinase